MFMKKVIKIFAISLLIVLSISRAGIAQSQNLRFEHIGIEEGLLNTQVNAILQDRKGYIWIGTVDGLNKYDGYTFTKYLF